MAIREWSVQILQKFSEEDDCQLKVPEHPAKGGADSDSLCQTLKRLFLGKPGKAYGRLQMHAEPPVCGPWIKQWCEQKIPFERMVNNAVSAIKDRLDPTPLVTHSYCLWAHEQQGDQDFLYCFIIESSITQVVNNEFAIEPIEHLDPQALSFGIKIDLTQWLAAEHQSEQEPVIVFLRRQQRKLADAACQGFGFTSSIDTVEETETVIKGIESYANTLTEPEARIFKKKAVDFCQEQNDFGEAVAIRELSQAADDQRPSAFVEFFREALPEASTNLHPDSRKLKQLIRFAGKTQGMSLSFSSEAINQNVFYNPEQDILTITEIPKSLKTRLKKYMEQNNYGTKQTESGSSAELKTDH